MRSRSIHFLILAGAMSVPAFAPRLALADEGNDDDAPPVTSTAPPGSEDEVLAQARTHFQAGREAFSARNYSLAVAEFQKAEVLKPSPVLDYNIGLCFEALGKKAKAIRAYQSYLQNMPDAQNRAEVEARLAGLEGRAAPSPSTEPPVPQYQAPSGPGAGYSAPQPNQYGQYGQQPDPSAGYQGPQSSVGRPSTGYKTERRWGLFGAGVGIFGTIYLLNVVGAGIDNANGGSSSELFVPLVGPLIYAAHYNGGGGGVDEYGNPIYGAGAMVITGMVFDFLGQAAGIAMAIAGATTTHKVPVWAITPRFGQRFAGVSVGGQF